MRFLSTLAAAATITAFATASVAGGLSDEIMEAPVEAVDVMEEPAGSSISPTIIILGILGALLIGAAINAADDDDEEEVVDDGPVMDDTVTITTTEG